MKSFCATIGFYLFWALVCSAQVTVTNVTEALKQMEKRQPTDWAYTQALTSKKEAYVARYDPRVPNTLLGWTLLQMNGSAPSAKEAKKFYRDLAKELEKSDQAGTPAPALSELIRAESLKHLRIEDTGQVVFEFVPNVEGMDEGLLGELVYNPDWSGIDRIRVWNPEDYSPFFSVKVTDFSLEFSFESLGSEVVLTQLVSKVKGRVGFLKKIDEGVRVSFSDYELLEEEGE